MTKSIKILSILVSFIICFNIYGSISESNKFNLTTLGRIPILHEGRIKPLDTFARVHLLAIYGTTQLKINESSISAMEWMFESIYEPEVAFDRRIFDIRNSEVVEAFNFEAHKTHKYSFNEVSVALRNNIENISKLYRVNRKGKFNTPYGRYDLTVL